MLWSYVQLDDGTQFAYSETRDDGTVRVAVERPVDFGFDHAECFLPAVKWFNVEGFSTDELDFLTEFVRSNAPFIFELAERQKSWTGGGIMPRILVFGQYVLFFWIAENGEPVHIHVGIKRAAANSTKFWLTKNGGCTLANNESKIPAKDLRDLSKLITMNHRYICDKWRETFGDDSLTFYC